MNKNKNCVNAEKMQTNVPRMYTGMNIFRHMMKILIYK